MPVHEIKITVLQETEIKVSKPLNDKTKFVLFLQGLEISRGARDQCMNDRLKVETGG
jgi:hypothetical protein